MSIELDKLKLILEAVLMTSGEPLSIKQLDNLFHEEDQVTPAMVKDALVLIEDHYQGRGIELVEVATGFRFQTRPDLAPWVQKQMDEKPPKMSRAMLETLALIAYKQPITRAEIEDVRGVAVSTNIIKSLTEREWIRVIGHRDVPGKPSLFATTKTFLDDLNLTSLAELPTLAEIKSLEEIAEPGSQMQLDVKPDISDEEKAAVLAATVSEAADFEATTPEALPSDLSVSQIVEAIASVEVPADDEVEIQAESSEIDAEFESAEFEAESESSEIEAEIESSEIEVEAESAELEADTDSPELDYETESSEFESEVEPDDLVYEIESAGFEAEVDAEYEDEADEPADINPLVAETIPAYEPEVVTDELNEEYEEESDNKQQEEVTT